MKIITKEVLMDRITRGDDLKNIYVGNTHLRTVIDNRFLMYGVTERSISLKDIIAEDAIIIDLEK